MELSDNLNLWEESYDWSRQGEEWSQAWGGSEAQWFGCVFPRIHRFLPAGTILEIAPGFGRWTRFLAGLCSQYVGVDLSARCVEFCQRRFARQSTCEFHVNDGKSLDFIADGSVDFAFSFDSLVHAETDVLESYVEQLARKLQPDGAGFIHHSNCGEYADEVVAGSVGNQHARALSVTALRFAECCERNRLCCVSQEIVNWGQAELIDCFSTLVPAGSKWARPGVVLRNPELMAEAELIKRIAPSYSSR
jgi:SAM-dependent methyltransferase